MSFSKAVWADARAEYESGQYDSIDASYKAFLKKAKRSKKWSKIPTLAGVRKRCTKEQWDRGRHESQIEDYAKQKTVELYGKMGVQPETAARVVGSAMLGGMPDAPGIQRIIEELRNMLGDSEGTGVTFLANLGSYIDDRLRDVKTSLTAADIYYKVTGQYPPKETKVTGGMLHGHVNASSASGKTPDELNRAILRMIERANADDD